MGIQSHYERDDAHSGTVVAAKWRAIWLEVQNNMRCCGGDTLINYYNYQSYQVQIRMLLQQLTLRYINASLDVQVAFFNVPDDYDADPGDTGDEIDQRNQALCLACESWVDEICNQGTSFIQGAVLDSIPFITGAIVVPFIPTLVVGFVALGAAFFAKEVWEELNNEAYRDYLACGMYVALKNESTASMAAFDAAFDNLPARPPPPEDASQDDARDIIELWLRGVVNDQENWLGFVSILGAAMSVSSTLPLGSCDCITCDTESYDFDGTAHHPPVHIGIDGDPPIFDPPNNDGEGGLWKVAIGRTGDGVESTITGVDNFLNCSIRIELTSNCPVARVKHWAKYSTSGINRWRILAFYDAAGDLVSTEFASLIGVTGGWEERDTGGISISGAKWLWIFEESRTIYDTFVWVDDIEITYG